MKKLLFLFLSFLFFFCNAETLKAGIEESYVPAGFYGSWGVISKLKNCTNPDMFNYESRDIWILSGYGNVLILENIESGARSEITIKEKATDGKTLKFERCTDLWCTFLVSLHPYANRKDYGEAAYPRRIGEVRCVVLVERYGAQR